MAEKRGGIREAEEERDLERARDGLLAGYDNAFGAWYAGHQQALRKAARSILLRYAPVRPGAGWRGWRCVDETMVDDLVAVGMEAAWKALVGFKYFCPTCKQHDERFGEKLCWSTVTAGGLLEHARAVHGVVLAAPPIRRRVWYMIGSAMQTAAKWEIGKTRQHRKPSPIELRELRREAFLASATWGWWLGKAVERGRYQTVPVEAVADLPDPLDALVALELRMTRERELATLGVRARQVAYLLMQGRDLDDALRISSTNKKEVLGW